jgi:putative transposase
VVITDQRKRYGAAKRERWPGVAHRQRRCRNNRCENSHRPTRQREYRMRGFKSAGHAPLFVSAYVPIAQRFRPRWHLLVAAYREAMRNCFASWAARTGTERATESIRRTGEGYPLGFCASPPQQLDHANRSDSLC